MEDNIEESASMGVPSSAAVEADPDEVAEGGVSGGGVVEVRVTNTVFGGYHLYCANPNRQYITVC